jgi:imidazoleglycerol-phosphate dehydratase
MPVFVPILALNFAIIANVASRDEFYMSNNRTAKIERNTNETKISVDIDLDGSGKSSIDVGIPFLEHMLEQVARHGVFDLTIFARGDLEIDAHHTVEDTGITLGQAFAEALKDKKGICRYGHAYVPLDEAISRVVIDCSGRPGLDYHVEYPRARVGDFDVDLLSEFFQGFVNHSLVTLHIDNIRGKNSHHIAETIFKAFGRALRMAVTRDPRIEGTLPSTKGAL